MEKLSTSRSQADSEIETGQPLQKHKLYTSQRVINDICEMLSISGIVSLLLLSKDANRMVTTYMKGFLLKNKLVFDLDPTTPADFFYKTWRSTFSRELHVGGLVGGNIPRPISQSHFQCYSRFLSLGVKDFSIGTKFTVFHLLNDNLVFMKIEEYLNPLHDIDTLWRKNTRENIKSFYTGSKNLMYQTQQGQIHIVFDEADKPSSQFSEAVLEFTLQKPVHFWAASYTFAVFGFNDEVAIEVKGKAGDGEEEEKTQIKELQPKLATKTVNKRVTRAYSLADLSPQDLNSSERFTEISGLDDSEIGDLCVGSTHAYFVDDKSVLHECDMSNKESKKFEAAPFEPLKKKPIRHVFSGWSYFFAIEQDFMKGIGGWTNEEVLNWASKTGFQDYVKILKHEAVNGETLASADRRYIIDTLGVTREDLQSKFFYEINKVIEDSRSNQKMYGWGNNNNGQLALSGSGPFVKYPQQIPLPNLYEKEEISKVECGFKCSVLLTNLGRVFISDPEEAKGKQAKKPSESETQKPEKGEKKAEKGKKGKGDKTKGSDEEIEVKEKKAKAHHWEDISVVSINPKNKKINKIVNVSLNKDYIVVLGSFMGYLKKGEDPHQVLLKYEASGQRLRDGDYVIKRILWDTSYKKEDFTVGYEDRFLGIMEMPFDEFITSEVPRHRIRFFKQKGTILWDRTRRINNL